MQEKTNLKGATVYQGGDRLRLIAGQLEGGVKGEYGKVYTIFGNMQ